MFLVPLVPLGCAYLELLEQKERKDLSVSLDSQVQYQTPFTKSLGQEGSEIFVQLESLLILI